MGFGNLGIIAGQEAAIDAGRLVLVRPGNALRTRGIVEMNMGVDDGNGRFLSNGVCRAGANRSRGRRPHAFASIHFRFLPVPGAFYGSAPVLPWKLPHYRHCRTADRGHFGLGKLNTVTSWKFSPGFSSVVGKSGWFGASG